MKTNWNILYRGSLDSCNYDCHYCPFAKKKNTKEELAADKVALNNFVQWVEGRQENINILLTPWGEGLIRSYYQEAMIRLSHRSQVKKIAIQTNLSCALEWVKKVNKESFALWITYHPDEVNFDKFITKCQFLIAQHIQFSIGVVGLKEHFKAIEKLKESIPERYIWINAYKREEAYYTNAEQEWLTSIDTLFPLNNQKYQTKGKPCQAGHTSFSVNEKGDVFPCHFIDEKLGNIYRDDIHQILAPKLCVNDTCGCYIGYIHRGEMDAIYGDKILERIPVKFK